MSRKKILISDININKIGGRIAFIRVQKGLKQSQFADLIGISEGNLSGLENHKYEPSFQPLSKISKVFNINTEWLLTGEGNPYKEEVVLEDETLFLDYRGAPIKEHLQQGPHMGLAAGYGENDARNKAAAETIYNKDRPVSPEEKFSDLETRLATIEHLLKKPSVSLPDPEIRSRDIELEKLKKENDQLKLMLRGSGQDFKDLINSLKQIIEKDSPPDGERRRCMEDIVTLLTGTQNKLNNGDLTNH